MSYRKHGLKALGLSFLAVLGFMALAASGAQASGKVLVLNAKGESVSLTVGVTGEADTPGNDRLWVLGLNLEISCPKAKVTSGELTAAGHGKGVLLFEECVTQGVNLSGELIGSSCKPTPQTIEAKVLILIILHENGILGIDLSPTSQNKTEHNEPKKGKPYILVTPLDGLTLSTVKNSNPECLLPELAIVKGCVVASITTGHAVTHLIDTRGMLTLFGCELKYGGNVAHLEADALVKLSNEKGSHAGLSWGVE